MTPLHLILRPGEPIFDQVVFAATKAIATRTLPPGQPFPSVRALAADLKIHPNTALKVIQRLTEDGLLEVRPGIGTVVAAAPRPGKGDATAIAADVERLMVNAKRLGLSLTEVIDALRASWKSGAAPIELVSDDHRVRKAR
jgi:GntR family transcriptional regulator